MEVYGTVWSHDATTAPALSSARPSAMHPEPTIAADSPAIGLDGATFTVRGSGELGVTVTSTGLLEAPASPCKQVSWNCQVSMSVSPGIGKAVANEPSGACSGRMVPPRL